MQAVRKIHFIRRGRRQLYHVHGDSVGRHGGKAETASPSTAASNVFKFEILAYVHSQQGGIRTCLQQVEVRLKLANITGEQEKYEYLIASLPNEIMSRVYDLVNIQPPMRPYTTLVERIENEFQPTESEQIKQLIHTRPGYQ